MPPHGPHHNPLVHACILLGSHAILLYLGLKRQKTRMWERIPTVRAKAVLCHIFHSTRRRQRHSVAASRWQNLVLVFPKATRSRRRRRSRPSLKQPKKFKNFEFFFEFGVFDKSGENLPKPTFHFWKCAFSAGRRTPCSRLPTYSFCFASCRRSHAPTLPLPPIVFTRAKLHQHHATSPSTSGRTLNAACASTLPPPPLIRTAAHLTCRTAAAHCATLCHSHQWDAANPAPPTRPPAL